MDNVRPDIVKLLDQLEKRRAKNDFQKDEWKDIYEKKYNNGEDMSEFVLIKAIIDMWDSIIEKRPMHKYLGLLMDWVCHNVENKHLLGKPGDKIEFEKIELMLYGAARMYHYIMGERRESSYLSDAVLKAEAFGKETVDWQSLLEACNKKEAMPESVLRGAAYDMFDIIREEKMPDDSFSEFIDRVSIDVESVSPFRTHGGPIPYEHMAFMLYGIFSVYEEYLKYQHFNDIPPEVLMMFMVPPDEGEDEDDVLSEIEES